MRNVILSGVRDLCNPSERDHVHSTKNLQQGHCKLFVSMLTTETSFYILHFVVRSI